MGNLRIVIYTTLDWADTHSLQNVEVMKNGFESVVLPMAKAIKKHVINF